MKARPILFSGPMIRALLEGRKTQTRRIVKGQALDWLDGAGFTPEFVADPGNVICSYGKPGDLLWVREGIVQSVSSHLGADGEYHTEWGLGAKYIADCAKPGRDSYGNTFASRPSIHMPRWASRLTLEITGVRVERLQNISEADALAEGDPARGPIASENTHRDWYAHLWESINGRGSWNANPFVWVISFRVHQQNVDQFLAHLATTSTGKESDA